MQYEFIDDYQAAVERLVRQRNATQRELDLFKGSTEGWAELHKAEVDRLNAEIARLMNECP